MFLLQKSCSHLPLIKDCHQVTMLIDLKLVYDHITAKLMTFPSALAVFLCLVLVISTC